MAARPLTRARKKNAHDFMFGPESDERVRCMFDAIAGGYAIEKQRKYPNIVMGDGLYNFCRDNELHYLTVLDTIINNPELSRLLDAARRARGQRLVDEALGIVDEPVEDMVQAVDKKTRIDTRLKVAKSEYAEAYGDKLQVTNLNIDLTNIMNEAQQRLEKVINGSN